jgi:hypothetical protein
MRSIPNSTLVRLSGVRTVKTMENGFTFAPLLEMGVIDGFEFAILLLSERLEELSTDGDWPCHLHKAKPATMLSINPNTSLLRNSRRRRI